MMGNTLDLVLLLLASSVVVVALFRSLQLPPVIGYLLVGALIGPNALKLMPDAEGTRHLAEFGVVFLMFTIGLEFSLPRLFSMKRLVFGLGLAQVVLTMLFILLFAALVGMPWRGAVALGGALAMSSTAVASKLLVERAELDSAHGRQVMGVLLFQDIAVVPLLILLPALAGEGNDLSITLLWAALKAVVTLVVVIFLGQRLMRAWFTVVARRKSTELFILNVLLITLGLSWFTELVGLSLALGAFLAGMLISETEYRFKVEEDIKPFRDVLLGLFFITVGMYLDPRLISQNALFVAALLVGLLLLKLLVVFVLSRLSGATTGVALRSGLWLCAGGEFGFVLLTLGMEKGLLSPVAAQSVLAALVLSLVIAPLLIHYSDKIVLRFVASEWLLRSMALTTLAARTITNDKHAILWGYGRTRRTGLGCAGTGSPSSSSGSRPFGPGGVRRDPRTCPRPGWEVSRLSRVRQLLGCGDAPVGERVRPRRGALGGRAEPVEVVGPAAVVGVGGQVVEAAVDELEQGAAVGSGKEVDLDGGGSGWDLDLGAFPPVGEHHTAAGDELDVGARARVAVGVGPADGAVGDGVEGGVVGHPVDEQLGIDEQFVELVGRRVDHKLLGDELHARFLLVVDVARFSAVALRRANGVAQNSSRNPATSATRCRSAR